MKSKLVNFIVSTFVFGIFFLVPSVIFAQEAPYVATDMGFVPCEGTFCSACHFIELANRIVDWLIGFMALLFAVIMVVSGFRLVISGGNQSAKENAKSSLTNGLIGFLIVLGAWLAIDTLMRALIGDDGQINGKTPWSQIECWGQKKSGIVVYEKDGQFVVSQSDGTTTAVDSSKLVQCPPTNSACSVAVLKNAGLTEVQANIMSCIAMTESSGIAATPPYNIKHPGSNSSACGTFQVVQKTWNGNASGGCSSFSKCQNAQCNMSVMVSLVKKNEYRDWSCEGCNAKASACVAKYGK